MKPSGYCLKPGGFSAHGGLEIKAKMLEIEGATGAPDARWHRSTSGI